MKTLFPLIVGAALAGCSLVPAPEVPAVPDSGWANAGAVSGTVPLATDWWRAFGSAELDALVRQALANNADIGQALARVEQARAAVRVAGGSRFPALDGSLSASQNAESLNANTLADGTSAQLSLSYEVDLFGRNQAGRLSAIKSLTASEADSDATRLLVAAETARIYTSVLALQDRVAMAESNLAAARQLLVLTQTRFDAGAVSALEVTQQRSLVASSEASIASLRQQLGNSRNALAVLLGVAPSRLPQLSGTLAGLTVPPVSATLPAEVLARRPDIKAAEARLAAAGADIGAARAAFFPSLNLGLGTGFAFDGDTPVTTLTAGVLAPIFHGGELRGALDKSWARRRELAESYRATALTAFQEVEDGLLAMQAASARNESLNRAATDAREAERIARMRFDAGASDFLTLLDAQRTRLSADDAAAQAGADRLSAAYQLIRALGGGY